jgi:hypothetical protein
VDSLGRVAYEAYAKKTSEKLPPLPSWEELSQDTRNTWDAAAEAVRLAVKGGEK